MGTVARRAKCWLTLAVASLYLAACLLPGVWGRGGFLECGTEIPGWAMVLGLSPLCCVSWPSLAAMIISAVWLGEDRLRRAFILACINILPVAQFLPAHWSPEACRVELRTDYYIWIAAVVGWAVGVGWLRWRERGARLPSKAKPVMDDS
jgi:hypothetical protein